MNDVCYKNLRASTLDELDREVNTAIKEGYEPVGGMTYVNGTLYPFCQSIYKKPVKERVYLGPG
jgi:hypothetical protein